MASSVAARLRRGHLLSRAWGRALRELRAATTTAVLSLSRPRPDRAAIVTLNADEENATAQAVLLGAEHRFARITLVTPDPEVSEAAVGLAARRLGLPVPEGLRFRPLGYRALLAEYRRSAETFSTHVLLPGRDTSGRRRHVHLTHGSGPKPDSTFRAPTNVLASITPQWVAQQLREYRLPPDTEVIEYMPRLEIMRRSVGDRSILERLGLDPDRPLVVWAPTYRVVRRGRELRVSGSVLSSNAGKIRADLMAELEKQFAGAPSTVVLKPHPHEFDSYEQFGINRLTNDDLRRAAVTPYELFGASSLLVTDYSSISGERAHCGLPVMLFRPDEKEYSASYRGLRPVPPRTL